MLPRAWTLCRRCRSRGKTRLVSGALRVAGCSSCSAPACIRPRRMSRSPLPRSSQQEAHGSRAQDDRRRGASLRCARRRPRALQQRLGPGAQLWRQRVGGGGAGGGGGCAFPLRQRPGRPHGRARVLGGLSAPRIPGQGCRGAVARPPRDIRGAGRGGEGGGGGRGRASERGAGRDR